MPPDGTRFYAASKSGNIGENFLHLDARKSTQRLRPDITQHVRGQQHARSRLVVWCLENAYLVIVTECPIHLLDCDSHRLHLRGPVSYSLSSLLGSVNPLVSELHQADV